MTWTKLDDAMGEHRKIQRALRRSRPAIALHFLGLLHCSRYLTDGFVEDEYVDEVVADDERESALAALVDQGLWTATAGGYAIHDYLEHNPSREKVLAQRAADAARKARGRQAASSGRPASVPPESTGTDAGVRGESARPVPSRPVPSIEAEQDASAPAVVDGEALGAVVAVLRTAPRLTFDPLYAGVANIMAAFPKANHTQAAHVAVARVADPTYHTTDGARALRFAINDLERSQKPRGDARRATPAPEPSSLIGLVADRPERAA